MAGLRQLSGGCSQAGGEGTRGEAGGAGVIGETPNPREAPEGGKDQSWAPWPKFLETYR